MPENNPLDAGFNKFNIPDISGVVFDSKTVNFNGEEHELVAENIPDGVTATYTNNKLTEVGETEAQLALSYTYIDADTDEEVTDVIGEPLTATLTVVQMSEADEDAPMMAMRLFDPEDPDTDIPDEFKEDIFRILREENNFNYLRVGSILAEAGDTLTQDVFNEFMEAYLKENAMSSRNHYTMKNIYIAMNDDSEEDDVRIALAMYDENGIEIVFTRLTSLDTKALILFKYFKVEDAGTRLTELPAQYHGIDFNIIDANDNSDASAYVNFLQDDENPNLYLLELKAPLKSTENFANAQNGDNMFYININSSVQPEVITQLQAQARIAATFEQNIEFEVDLKEVKETGAPKSYIYSYEQGLILTPREAYVNFNILTAQPQIGAPTLQYGTNIDQNTPKPLNPYFEIFLTPGTLVGEYLFPMVENNTNNGINFTINVIDSTESGDPVEPSA